MFVDNRHDRVYLDAVSHTEYLYISLFPCLDNMLIVPRSERYITILNLFGKAIKKRRTMRDEPLALSQFLS